MHRFSRQRLCENVSAATNKHTTVEELWGEEFSVRSEPSLYNENKWDKMVSLQCGGGFEYLHRSPASRRRRRKGNPVSGGITGPACSWGI
jgi:hypothetical protein